MSRNPKSEKLQQELLRHEGALELLRAAGFQPTSDGHLEVPPGHPVAAEAALAAVKRGAGYGGYVQGAKHSSRPEAAQELQVLSSLHPGARGPGGAAAAGSDPGEREALPGQREVQVHQFVEGGGPEGATCSCFMMVVGLQR